MPRRVPARPDSRAASSAPNGSPATLPAHVQVTTRLKRIAAALVVSPVVGLLLRFFLDTTSGTSTSADNQLAGEYTAGILLVVELLLQTALMVLSYNQFWELLRCDFVPRILMPSTTKNPQLYANRQRAEEQFELVVNNSPDVQGRYCRVKVEVYDPEMRSNALLECGIWEHPHAASDPENHKWILYLNANGVAYQDILPFTMQYAAQLHCSVLNLNYRGVQNSSGCTTGEQSLLADAEAALLYLKERRGVSPHNILVHGHSMGGAVAVQLASLHAEERLKCVADRTFARLGLVIGGMLTGMQGLIFGTIFSLAFAWIPIVTLVTCLPAIPQPALPYFIRGIWIIGVGIQSLVLLSRRLIPRSIQQNGGMCSRLAASLCVFLFPCLLVFGLHYVPWAGARLSAVVEYLFLCDVCGAILGYVGLLRWPLTHLASFMGWGLDPHRHFKSTFAHPDRPEADAANVLVIAHSNDGIVPYDSSLHRHLKLDETSSAAASRRDRQGQVKALLLNGQHPNGHMMRLDEDDETWTRFIQICSQLLQR